jgi:uncharacterized membrane protein YphA (DoxX/SURF4 family)
MNNPLKSTAATNLGILLARAPLGAVFLMAGIMKIKDIGVKKFVDMNTGNLPTFLPRPVGQTYLYGIPFFEVIVGTLLIFGLFTRSIAFVAAFMLVTFTIGVTGMTMGKMAPLLPHYNLVYIGIALLLVTTGGGKISLDRAFFGNDGLGR